MVREPEWDDAERAKMLALVEYEASVCECGFPESVADEDPDLELTFRVCPVCADLAKATRIQQAADAKAVEALGNTPPPEAPLPDDGRRVGLRAKRPPQNL